MHTSVYTSALTGTYNYLLTTNKIKKKTPSVSSELLWQSPGLGLNRNEGDGAVTSGFFGWPAGGTGVQVTEVEHLKNPGLDSFTFLDEQGMLNWTWLFQMTQGYLQEH